MDSKKGNNGGWGTVSFAWEVPLLILFSRFRQNLPVSASLLAPSSEELLGSKHFLSGILGGCTDRSTVYESKSSPSIIERGTASILSCIGVAAQGLNM